MKNRSFVLLVRSSGVMFNLILFTMAHTVRRTDAATLKERRAARDQKSTLDPNNVMQTQ